MNAQTTSAATLNDNVTVAQAGWVKIEPDVARRFLATRPDVRAVSDFTMSYPSDGAGISNGIAFVTATVDRGAGDESLDMVLRYSPGTTLIKQKSFAEEFATVQALEAAGIPVPHPLWLDADGSDLGAAGYLMERIEGEAPASGMYSKGLLAEASPTDRKELMLKAAGFHGRLKRAAIGADQVPHLASRGNGTNPIERELNWWLTEAKFNALDAFTLERLESGHRRLITSRPEVRPPTLAHGDPQLSNLMYRDGEIVAGIDWELSYLGYGEADLAFIIYWTEFQKQIDRDPGGTPTEAEYIARFEAESGVPVEHLDYFRAFIHWKLCAVLTASAETMPGYDAFWSMSWDSTVKALDCWEAGASG